MTLSSIKHRFTISECPSRSLLLVHSIVSTTVLLLLLSRAAEEFEIEGSSAPRRGVVVGFVSVDRWWVCLRSAADSQHFAGKRSRCSRGDLRGCYYRSRSEGKSYNIAIGSYFVLFCLNFIMQEEIDSLSTLELVVSPDETRLRLRRLSKLCKARLRKKSKSRAELLLNLLEKTEGDQNLEFIPTWSLKTGASSCI